MSDNSILFLFNNFIFQYLSIPAQFWDGFEMLLAVSVFFLALWQRVHWVNSLSKLRRETFFGVTSGQVAIYFHMVLSVLCCVDGYQLYMSPPILPHITSIVFLFSLFLGKLGIFLTYDKIPTYPQFDG